MAKGSAKKRLGVSSGILQSNAYCLKFSDIMKHFNERIQVTKKCSKSWEDLRSDKNYEQSIFLKTCVNLDRVINQ